MSTHPLLQELTTNLRSSKVQLQQVDQQLALLERQEKLARLVTEELKSYKTDQVWRSCGKAFVLQDKSKYVEDLRHDEDVVKEQSKALEIRKNYLETTVEKIVDNLRLAAGNQK